ncbi:hypothetical protein A2U01_0100409 [Trifolium medium]|uniref:Uncharacterized protein n=1 Tax=Trifolium medium TaxID=97028 RepID=A0A392USY7_9FABA|nr:hypothetical protein [Trifolium medium]
MALSDDEEEGEEGKGGEAEGGKNAGMDEDRPMVEDHVDDTREHQDESN